jgi:hypothetical protein
MSLICHLCYYICFINLQYLPEDQDRSKLPNQHELNGACKLPTGKQSKLRLNVENIPPTVPPRTVTLGYQHLPEGGNMVIYLLLNCQHFGSRKSCS